jgi:hypothetical protein
MSQDANEMTCEEVQSLLPDLNASGEDLEGHPHLKACISCRQIARELRIIAEEARKLFPPEWSDVPWWPR